MAKHDDMLEQGPREAPEPETAEQRSKNMGLKTAGGGIAAGGIGLAKAGVLGKFFFWLFAWHSLQSAWRISAWVGVAAVIVAITAFLVYRWRRENG